MKKLSLAHRQMLEDGCPKACLRENTPEAQAAVERLRKLASQPPQIRISNPKDIKPQADPGRPQFDLAAQVRKLGADSLLPDWNGRKPKKQDIVAQLLLRKEGCTVAEVLAATGWTKVGMPTMAQTAGLKLRKVKEGDVTRYFGSK